MTEEEKQFAINGYKSLLRDTDYQCLKHSDGALTDEEYEPIKEQRASWRQAINDLEATEVDG